VHPMGVQFPGATSATFVPRKSEASSDVKSRRIYIAIEDQTTPPLGFLSRQSRANALLVTQLFFILIDLLGFYVATPNCYP